MCGGGGAAAAVRWPEVRGRASAERTEKILVISVTLEMSRLIGWLNKYAACGVARDERAHVLRGGESVGRCERANRGHAGAAQAACREELSAGGRGERTHIKHPLHGWAAGEVKAQRLVEVLGVLSSRKGEAREQVRGRPVWARGLRASSVHAGKGPGWRSRRARAH